MNYIKNILLQNPQLNDEEIRSIYNNSANIPTVKTSVIASVRTTINDGRLI